MRRVCCVCEKEEKVSTSPVDKPPSEREFHLLCWDSDHLVYAEQAHGDEILGEKLADLVYKLQNRIKCNFMT